jgi:hypothetical protein
MNECKRWFALIHPAGSSGQDNQPKARRASVPIEGQRRREPMRLDPPREARGFRRECAHSWAN